MKYKLEICLQDMYAPCNAPTFPSLSQNKNFLNGGKDGQMDGQGTIFILLEQKKGFIKMIAFSDRFVLKYLYIKFIQRWSTTTDLTVFIKLNISLYWIIYPHNRYYKKGKIIIHTCRVLT